jgi:uncharacterized membrane protein
MCQAVLFKQIIKVFIIRILLGVMISLAINFYGYSDTLILKSKVDKTPVSVDVGKQVLINSNWDLSELKMLLNSSENASSTALLMLPLCFTT